MPGANAVLTATYRDVVYATYSLTVNSGAGSGQYPEGTVVNINANPAPTGRRFVVWVGDTATIANVSAASTTVTMPAASAVVTATYGFYRGDVNKDGFVGQTDLDELLGKWGQSVPPGQGPDLNGDGVIGLGDLDFVLAEWGQGTNPY
jgi:hypothetical protein